MDLPTGGGGFGWEWGGGGRGWERGGEGRGGKERGSGAGCGLGLWDLRARG